MPSVRLILTMHNHQPVGNFEDVFAESYRTSYLPFLDVIEGYPDLKFVLHTSGPLMEWLAANHPDYVARVRALVETGRVEILGGGFAEPILAMIPHRDRVGQIRMYSQYLESLFGQKVRGMWVPERVWEAHFVSALAEAGIEYTVLDDFHFQRTGLPDQALHGYYLTEDDGNLVKVFPGSERLRYLIPFHEPHASYEYLKRIAEERPGSTVVFADDGEKFGSWPETFDHVYTNGWLRHFCDMLSANRDWIQTSTFSRTVDETVPLGKVFLPDSSYREMTEWVLPAERFVEFEQATKSFQGEASIDRLRPFIRAGGFWRNFKAKYPESDEMYARMLMISRRLESLSDSCRKDVLASIRDDLYRAQCNCPYWHGSFGGLYLPHLRNAIYHHLIASQVAMDRAEGKTGAWVELEISDFNLDARQEIRLENERLTAFIRPAMGGHLYDFESKHALVNVLATLDRRPEPYHGTITAEALGVHDHAQGTFNPDRVILKQAHLDRMIVYDRHPRKAFVDHFYPEDVTLDELVACRDVERGDFATGTYLAKVSRQPDAVTLVMERAGRADGHAIRIRKSVIMRAGDSSIEVAYVLEDLPAGIALCFAPEINVAGMAGNADDRYFTTTDGDRLGTLSTRVDLADAEGIVLTDDWLDLRVELAWSQPASLWCYPIQTVSQSEGGFEGVYQSTAVVPRWRIFADETGRWEVRITWKMTPVRVASMQDTTTQIDNSHVAYASEYVMTPSI